MDMSQHILRRLITSLLVILVVSMITFVIMNILPGDPAIAALGGQVASKELVEQLREEMGLNAPLYVRYARFLIGALQGNFGRSLRTKALVTEEIAQTLPATVELMVGSLLVALSVGVPLGIVAAIWQNSWVDVLGISLATLGISVPVFWMGLILITFFSFQLSWLPASGAGSIFHAVLPSITLGFGGAAIIARMTRSSLLEVLHLDYIRTARAKGAHEQRVILVHALRNALIPVVTTVGLQIGGLLSGAVMVETVFSRPGIGRLLIQAVQSRDFPLAQALVFLVAAFYVTVNLLVDLLYKFLDPRVRFE
jgi:peptide/nickel transport system permease protein